MNIRSVLKKAALSGGRVALPILSYPAAQRLKVTVNELVRSASLQARAAALIAGETETVAAVCPMDLSVEAEAFGAEICFSENGVPAVTGQLVSGQEEAEALAVPGLDTARIPIALQAVREAKALIPDKPLLAGVIGPFSLAGRLMDVSEILYACFDEPDAVHTVLRKATDFLTVYTRALKEAGADGVILAEPLCGVLGPDMAAEFSHPYSRDLTDAVRDASFAVIYHNCGDSAIKMLPDLFALGADAYHFGNSASMRSVLENAPADILCMGNLDPVSCFVKGTPDSVRRDTERLIAECGGFPNFILSSGCDIPFSAPWENIRAFYDAVYGRGV